MKNVSMSLLVLFVSLTAWSMGPKGQRWDHPANSWSCTAVTGETSEVCTPHTSSCSGSKDDTCIDTSDFDNCGQKTVRWTADFKASQAEAQRLAVGECRLHSRQPGNCHLETACKHWD